MGRRALLGAGYAILALFAVGFLAFIGALISGLLQATTSLSPADARTIAPIILLVLLCAAGNAFFGDKPE